MIDWIFKHDVPYYQEKTKQLNDFICDYGISKNAQHLRNKRLRKAAIELSKKLGVLLGGPWNCRHKIVHTLQKEDIPFPDQMYNRHYTNQQVIDGIRKQRAEKAIKHDLVLEPSMSHRDDAIKYACGPNNEGVDYRDVITIPFDDEDKEPINKIDWAAIANAKTIFWWETKDGVVIPDGQGLEIGILKYSLDLSPKNNPLSCGLGMHFDRQEGVYFKCMYCGDVRFMSVGGVKVLIHKGNV